LTNIKLHLN